MLCFNRIVSLFALFISFALFAHARPTGMIEARADDNSALLTKFKAFGTEMDALAQGLADLAPTGQSPAAQVQKIATSFSAMSTSLGKTKANLSSADEEQIAGIVSSMLLKMADAADKCANAAGYKKWYPTWQELDVTLQSFMFQLPASCSYRTYELALKNAGKEACQDFHKMKMRLMVNNMLGMGIGYE